MIDKKELKELREKLTDKQNEEVENFILQELNNDSFIYYNIDLLAIEYIKTNFFNEK